MESHCCNKTARVLRNPRHSNCISVLERLPAPPGCSFKSTSTVSPKSVQQHPEFMDIDDQEDTPFLPSSFVIIFTLLKHRSLTQFVYFSRLKKNSDRDHIPFSLERRSLSSDDSSDESEGPYPLVDHSVSSDVESSSDEEELHSSQNKPGTINAKTVSSEDDITQAMAVAQALLTLRSPGASTEKTLRSSHPSFEVELDDDTITEADSDDDTKIGWVECCWCHKWHQLPPSMNTKDVPDYWICSMNSLNEQFASRAAG